MSEAAPSLPARQRLTLKILLPMSFGVLILLILFVAIIFWSLDREIQTNLNNKIADIDVSFQHMLDQQVQIMRIQLEQLAQSTELQQLMQQHDRSGLLAAAEPTFEKFLKPLQVSHLYFLNPDQTVFLRVHNPSRYGDLITRHTLQQAVTTQKTTHGVELGPLGTFTLRTVLPWVHNGKLLGYLELGKEIDLLIKNFFQYNKTALTLTIDKRFLKREQWEIGVRMLGKNNADWNLLPDKVVVQTSIPAMLPEILKILQEQQRNPDKPIELTFAGRKYRGRLQPLSDSAHHQIGEFLVLLDVTDTLTDYMRTVSIAVFLYLLATGGFLFFITSILGKTEAQLKTTDDQLVAEMTKVHKSNIQLESEIEERKTAEAALSKIHDELEERVRERTEQLWLSLEQTRQTRKQLTDIITSVTDALIVTDLDGKLQLLNPSAEQLFQCKADDCLGQPLKNIIHDTRLLTQLEEVLQQQLTDQRIQFTQISPDLHKPLFLQARTSIITDETNKAAGMIFLIHDISHEREMDRMKS
ncbi:MAG: PAS domain-containing protein, partial [Deltaproteobacteria bacterium]|nr:PAS domain-containing protein [Deltaproteobacteria bacterium]